MSFIDPWISNATTGARPLLVAVFHLGRSGSTVTSSLIRQHPIEEIYWEGEIFERNQAGHYEHLPTTSMKETIHDRALTCGSQVYAFETKIYQGQHIDQDFSGLEDYLTFLLELGFSKFISIRRENLLDQIISFYVGRQLGKWQINAKETAEIDTLSLPINTIQIGQKRDDLATTLDNMESRWNELDALLHNQAHLKIIYERDILHDPMIAYQHICQFMGLDQRENIEVTLGKINSQPKSTLLENYAEVRHALSQTAYATML